MLLWDHGRRNDYLEANNLYALDCCREEWSKWLRKRAQTNSIQCFMGLKRFQSNMVAWPRSSPCHTCLTPVWVNPQNESLKTVSLHNPEVMANQTKLSLTQLRIRRMFIAKPFISECLCLSLCLTELLNSDFRAQYLSTWSTDYAESWHTYNH